jgi:hypothetical protein
MTKRLLSPPASAGTVLCILLTLSGCGQAPDYRDQRLADFAQRSTSEQVQQNARMAELVQRDAESRRELLATHQELTTQLNRQQSVIDAGRDRLEQDRREIAQQRHRDPIIAATLQNVGLLMACLVPLLLAGLIVWQMKHQEPDHAAIAELLVCELTSDKPLFLPAPVHPRLTVASINSPRLPSHDEPDAGPDLPF